MFGSYQATARSRGESFIVLTEFGLGMDRARGRAGQFCAVLESIRHARSAAIPNSTWPNGKPAMKSLVVKRSVVINGHKTSISLEEAFWKGLKEIAGARKMTLSDLISSIDAERKHANLSSAIRLFILDFHRSHLEQAAARNVALARSANTA